jgi:hypothetical protein
VIDAGDGDEEETGMGSGDGGVRGVVAVGIGRGGRGGGGWEEERERVRARRGEDGRGADGAEETEAMASVAERKASVAERRGRRQRLAEPRAVDAYGEYISSSRDNTLYVSLHDNQIVVKLSMIL